MTPTEGSEAGGDRLAAFVRRTLQLGGLMATIATLAAWVFWSSDLALGIVFGALFALANFRALAASLRRALEVSTSGSEAGANRTSVPVPSVLRATLTLLALVLVLWYMPARPEGLAIGIAIALFSAVVAALATADRT